MSSCFAEDSVSMPGKAASIFRNSACKDYLSTNARQFFSFKRQLFELEELIMVGFDHAGARRMVVAG